MSAMKRCAEALAECKEILEDLPESHTAFVVDELKNWVERSRRNDLARFFGVDVPTSPDAEAFWESN